MSETQADVTAVIIEISELSSALASARFGWLHHGLGIAAALASSLWAQRRPPQVFMGGRRRSVSRQVMATRPTHVTVQNTAAVRSARHTGSRQFAQPTARLPALPRRAPW